MNTHKHARLTCARRFEVARQRVFQGLSGAPAAGQGVTPATAHKWLTPFPGWGTRRPDSPAALVEACPTGVARSCSLALSRHRPSQTGA
ncbi:MAG: leucine zipper domain-containing protein [Rubrivivax sp.]